MKRKMILLTMLFAIVMMGMIHTEVKAAGAVKLDKTKVVLEKGTTQTLTVKNTASKVKWSTSDKNVVKVKDGELTPVKVGMAKVTAKVNGKEYTCRVTVADYTGMSVEQKAVVSYALQYVGNRYSYGGSSLTKGTDCSGFTMAVYKEFGYKLTHNSNAQLKETKKVSMKNIKPGDIIFYGSSKSNCNHVALYIGNEKVVHASTYSTGITVSDYKYRKYVGVGRVLKKETYESPQGYEDESVTRFAKSK